MYRSHSGYFARAFGDLAAIAQRLRAKVDVSTFDTMIGTGLSGTLVVPTLAREIGCLWAIVRKEYSPHACGPVEGDIGDTWLFVDDLISSGATLRRVKDVVGTLGIVTAYVGTYMYERDEHTYY